MLSNFTHQAQDAALDAAARDNARLLCQKQLASTFRKRAKRRWLQHTLLALLASAAILPNCGCDQADPLSHDVSARQAGQGSMQPMSRSTITSQSVHAATASSKKSRESADPTVPVDENGFVTFGESLPVPVTAPADSPIPTDLVPTETTRDDRELAANERAASNEAKLDASSPAEFLTIGDVSPSDSSTNSASTAALSPAPLEIDTDDSNQNAASEEAGATSITLGEPVSLAPRSDALEPTPADPEPATGQSPTSPKIIPAGNRVEQKALPDEANVATAEEKNQKIADGWPKPQALLFITGQQQGYLEPCGCTGLANQKGGLNRRDTLLQQLKGRGWNVAPIDVGGFERRQGAQAAIKFQTTVAAMKDMGYRAATLGVDDYKLSSTDLIAQIAASEPDKPTAVNKETDSPYISANTYVIIEEFMPKRRIIEIGGRKIGVTAVLGDSYRQKLAQNGDVVTAKAAESLKPVMTELQKAGCDYFVLLAHASIEESAELARQVPGFDLVVTAGGYGEPTYMPEPIEKSKAVMVQVGTKGMYAGLFGLYPDSKQPFRYQRVALSSQFEDSPRMLDRFAAYQRQLRDLGFEKLGISPATHPSGREFVGSQACADCHTKAFEKWQETPHSKATSSLVKPGDRSEIARHFDPECLSCHVTGWNPQKYYPYATGYESLEHTPLLTGNGCENCHGPGSEHVKAENGDVKVDNVRLKLLQEQMRLSKAEARERCLECHDLDNSPDFQPDGAFEKYWEKIAHPWRD